MRQQVGSKETRHRLKTETKQIVEGVFFSFVIKKRCCKPEIHHVKTWMVRRLDLNDCQWQNSTIKKGKVGGLEAENKDTSPESDTESNLLLGKAGLGLEDLQEELDQLALSDKHLALHDV